MEEVRIGGALIVKDYPLPAPDLKTDSVDFEDCLMSLRAGIINALCEPLILGTQVGGTPTAEDRLATDLVPAGQAFKATSLKSDYLSSMPKTRSPIKIVELVRLPELLSNLDFNRTIYQGLPIIKAEIFCGGYDKTLKSLETRCASDFQSALAVLNNKNKGDQHAADILSSFVNDQFERSNISTFVRRRAVGNELTTSLATVSPSIMIEALSTRDFEEMFQIARSDMEDLRNKPIGVWPPYDCMLPIGKQESNDAGQHVVDSLFLLNPFVVAGSMAAKSIVMSAEAGIRQATQKENWRALEYLPGLRSIGFEYYQKHLENVRNNMNADKPLSLCSALYSYGFLNIHNHIDNVDYRCGIVQGRNEGAAATYNALKDNLSYLNLKPLSANPSIDEVIEQFAVAAKAINDLITKLNMLLDLAQATITKLREDISSLSSRIQTLLRQLELTGKAVSIFAGAGTGFLIGGPAGAVLGALVGKKFFCK